MRFHGLGAPLIQPEPKPRDLFSFPLSMVPTAWDTPNQSPPLPSCTWMEIYTIASLEAVLYYRPYR